MEENMSKNIRENIEKFFNAIINIKENTDKTYPVFPLSQLLAFIF
ncbi:hypothetical protein ES708_21143 [subsurface metagenome]